MALDMAQTFAAIALALEDSDAEITVDKVVDLVSDCVPNDGASLLLVRGKRIELSASSTPLAEQADRLQIELGEGPGQVSIHCPETLVAQDLATDGRWPTWSAAVARIGVASALSVRLRTLGEVVGTLDLYSRRPGAFDVEDASVAAIFADHAAVALAAAHSEIGLRRAIDARHVIGQAQGMLMQRFGIDADRAFAILRRYSQHQNVRLRVVAERLVAQGALPEDGLGPDSIG